MHKFTSVTQVPPSMAVTMVAVPCRQLSYIAYVCPKFTRTCTTCFFTLKKKKNFTSFTFTLVTRHLCPQSKAELHQSQILSILSVVRSHVF